MKIIFALLSLLFLALPFDLRGQENISFEKTQKGERRLVSVPVIVSDRDGRYIPGLKKEDFTLYENGVEQKIAFFATYDEPINVALLIDTSESTRNTLREIKEAAEDFIGLLNPNDRCLIATFDAQLNILTPLTSNPQTMKESLAKVQTAQREGSVLFSSVKQIAEKSFTEATGRKVIVVLSDGKDFGSPLSKNELLGALEESDVSIYGIFYQTGMGTKLTVSPNGQITEAKEEKKPKVKKPKKKKGYRILIPGRGDIFTTEEIKLSEKLADIQAVNVLQQLSDTTAGRFYSSDAPNLKGTFKRIAGELRQQYRIGYYTRDSVNAAVHDISVKVGRPDAVVRARGKFRATPM
ncbi:MAG: VWA domain-containing protein [Acidobacteriota bacterium]|nr:VWA domain-containing protein [Acidobacteriota bacterium]